MKKIIFIAYCFLCCAVFAQEKKENIVAKVVKIKLINIMSGYIAMKNN